MPWAIRRAAEFLDALDGDGVLAKAAIDVVLGPPVIPAPLTPEQEGQLAKRTPALVATSRARRVEWRGGGG
jgi:hypothetical protein